MDPKKELKQNTTNTLFTSNERFQNNSNKNNFNNILIEN